MKHLKRFNEDVYYEPRYRDKTPKEFEDEIYPIVEEWIDEQVGSEISTAGVMRGGTEIHCGVNKRIIQKEEEARGGRRQTTPEDDKRAEEAAKEDWRESAPELIDVLKREGYGIYTLGSVTRWGMTFWRDDEASGGPLSDKVRVHGSGY